jgi:glycine cleavage system aminomethyltransferase T
MFSPTTDKYLGMALVETEYSTVGAELDVMIRNQPRKVKIVPRPFYTPAYRR